MALKIQIRRPSYVFGLVRSRISEAQEKIRGKCPGCPPPLGPPLRERTINQVDIDEILSQLLNIKR